jgi:hypothetical protein
MIHASKRLGRDREGHERLCIFKLAIDLRVYFKANETLFFESFCLFIFILGVQAGYG